VAEVEQALRPAGSGAGRGEGQEAVLLGARFPRPPSGHPRGVGQASGGPSRAGPGAGARSAPPAASDGGVRLWKSVSVFLIYIYKYLIIWKWLCIACGVGGTA